MNRNRTRTRHGGQLIVLMIGAVFLAIGLLLAVVLPNAMFGRLWAFPSAAGQVVEVVAEPGQKGGVLYRPTVEFEARNGEPYRFASTVSSSPPSYAVGDAVVVRYNPANPRDAEIEGDAVTASAILRIIGGVFAVLGSTIGGLAGLTIYLQARAPEYVPALSWWMGIGGGLAGAGLFAVPAALAFPLLALAYQRRPNFLFRAEADPSGAFLIGAIFSVVGLVVLIILIVIARNVLPGRPRWPARARGPFEW